MSFCPSCGAQNSDDARFCNKCGTAITAAAAAPPSPGATVPSRPIAAPAASPTSPQPSPSTSGTVTLTGIGIQSPGRAYAILGLGALAFLALGAGIAYIGLHNGSSAAVATAETTEPGASDGEGAIPEGVDVPDDDFVMTSGARVVKRGPSAPGTTTSGSTGDTTTGDTTPPATRTSGGATSPTGGTHTGTRPTTSHSGSTGTGSTGSTGTGSTGSTGSTGTGSTGTGSTGSTDSTTGSTGSSTGTSPPPTSSPDWAAMEGTVDPTGEPDYQMQMYSTQVRRFIRQYLLPQATACFEHASAVSRDPVRGTVAIGFDIDARGHAQSATIDRNTTGMDALARCLQNNVNTWQLPPPPEGTAPIQMQMPFTR